MAASATVHAQKLCEADYSIPRWVRFAPGSAGRMEFPALAGSSSGEHGCISDGLRCLSKTLAVDIYVAAIRVIHQFAEDA